MKLSLAIVLASLAGCVTEPTVDTTEQLAVTKDSTDSDVGAECAAEPEQALDIIEATFGVASPEYGGGLSCWRAYDRDIAAADAFARWCWAQPPLQRPNCSQIYADMRMMAARRFFDCIVFRSRWWCPWRWGHTQTWGSDYTQD